MTNQSRVERITPLANLLRVSLQTEFGWLLTGTRLLITETGPGRQEQQDRVDSSVQGLLVVYLFGRWEEFVDPQIEREWLHPYELTRLQGLRHIRHSVALGFEGIRADQCRAEFESIMGSRKPFRGVEWDRSADTIDLSRAHVAYECHQSMYTLSRQLVDRLANDRQPLGPSI